MFRPTFIADLIKLNARPVCISEIVCWDQSAGFHVQASDVRRTPDLCWNSSSLHRRNPRLDWASNDTCHRDVVMACGRDVPALEALALV